MTDKQAGMQTKQTDISTKRPTRQTEHTDTQRKSPKLTNKQTVKWSETN